MKHLKLPLALSMALCLALFTGCSEDEDDDNNGTPVDEFALMAEITDAQFATWATTPVKDAIYVHDHMADLFIVDLRSATDFATGHIEGAHNVTLANLADYLATNNTTDDEVALVCYSGQTAAFANMAMRMLGFDTFSMKWGMAGWNDNNAGPWNNNISSAFAAQMVTTASPALGSFAFPELNTGLTTGQAILEARVEAIIAEGFDANSMTAANLMAVPGDYQIINYWSNEHYLAMGHINGALQLTPGNLTTTTDLDALNPEEAIALYCYTGQTSAFVGFYLNALGYDMKSVKFGANALFHDTMTANAWALQGNNFPVVPM